VTRGTSQPPKIGRDNLQNYQYATDWEKREFVGTIRLRFDKGYADIVVTGQGKEDFIDAYGESLYNYLIKNCVNIHTRVWEEKVGN
jgi:hypothetical protein